MLDFNSFSKTSAIQIGIVSTGALFRALNFATRLFKFLWLEFCEPNTLPK